MKTFLLGYLIAINVLGFFLMGLDKWKARRKRWRIPEKTLFLTALLGGSIGSLIGMYLFRHKTRKLRFSIGLPVLLVLQILCVVFFFIYRNEQMESPSAAVSRELSLIQELDETTIQNFISYENLMSTPPSDTKPGEETTEAVKLFFKNFQYHIHSEKISGDTATVSAEIINIDTRALAKELCLALTARNLKLAADAPAPESFNDYFALLRDALEHNSYGLTATTAYFHLKKMNNIWVIQADETLQDQLVSGFISWINDPTLLAPQEVLTLYMEEFSSLNAQEWIDYLKIDDVFSTGSPTYSSQADQVYMEKIAEYFSYSIENCETDGSNATASLTITSINLSHVLSAYKEKLLNYARTTESITSDEQALADSSAKYLLEALKEDAPSTVIPVTVTLYNDGHTWQLEISEELTNALLGNLSEALKAFASE